jgi:hypothetical protein
MKLLFKQWKQGGLVDEWSGTKACCTLCKVYDKLLAVVRQSGIHPLPPHVILYKYYSIYEYHNHVRASR